MSQAAAKLLELNDFTKIKEDPSVFSKLLMFYVFPTDI